MSRTYVELVEDDGPLPPEADRRPGLLDVVRRHPVRAAGAAGVVVLVVVAGVVGQVVVDGRERARLARLADVPGILRPVELPLHTRYVAEGDTAEAAQNGIAVGELLIAGGYQAMPTESPRVIAIDRATAAPVWQVAVDLPPAAVPAPDVDPQAGPSSNAWCVAAVDGAPPRVACIVSRSYGWQVEENGLERDVAVSGLVVLDATDGAVVARYDEPLGSEIRAGADEYWVASVDADRSGVRVVAHSYDGEVRWTSDVAVPGSVPVGVTPAVVSDGDRTVLGVGTRAWVLGPDGSPGPQLGGGTGEGYASPVPGGVLIETYDPSDGRQEGGTIWRDDGTTIDLGDDELFWLSVDDRSRPDAFLTVSGGAGPLVRRDESGAELWRADITSGNAGLLVDGTVFVPGGDSLAAVDADTGDVLWRTTMPKPSEQLFTDGTVLLAVDGRVLRAYGMEDGRPRWSAQLVERDGVVVLERMVSDDPSDATGGAVPGRYDGGWWSMTGDGHLVYSTASESRYVVVLD